MKSNCVDQIEQMAVMPEYNGCERPTDAALNVARCLLHNLEMPNEPEFTPDCDGGLDIEWEMLSRKVVCWIAAPGDYFNLTIKVGDEPYKRPEMVCVDGFCKADLQRELSKT